MLRWTCIGSEKSGFYTNYYRHRDSCIYCTSELDEEKQQKMKKKQQNFRALDDTSRITSHGPEQQHKLIVDSTFIAIPELYDSEERKTYYHAKNSTNYALKVQIACNFHHRIVHVSKCYHGSVQDITIVRDSGLLEHVNDSVQIIADKGYIDEENVVTPRKRPYRRELTDEDKDFNRDINSAIAAIENINQCLKGYAIIGNVYRGAIDNIHETTQIVQVAAFCDRSSRHGIVVIL
ncbi:unnamed protein product [Rotaria sp. Silwood1]|nr:unnamed protein product [Rotaria sp. Silwood1]CAF5025271.1 unnamed protein product [Rotaria sp. Silwood1]